MSRDQGAPVSPAIVKPDAAAPHLFQDGQQSAGDLDIALVACAVENRQDGVGKPPFRTGPTTLPYRPPEP